MGLGSFQCLLMLQHYQGPNNITVLLFVPEAPQTVWGKPASSKIVLGPSKPK